VANQIKALTADQARLAGLAAIVKGRLRDALIEVRRKYAVDAAIDGHVVVRENPNVVLDMTMNHAVDELVMRVRADVDMLMSPETAARAARTDAARADAEQAKAATAREEAIAAVARRDERMAEREAARLASENYLRAELDARWRKKEGELSRKITEADRRMAGAEETARARIKAEAGVVRVVSQWLRFFTTLRQDDASIRASLLELDAVDFLDV
jgi:hypothetical protein